MSSHRMFCAVCGTQTPPFVDNLCEKCYFKEYPLEIQTAKEVEVILCPGCDQVRIRGGAGINPHEVGESLEIIIREMGRSVIIENMTTEHPYRFIFLEDEIDETKARNRGVKSFQMQTQVFVQPHREFREVEATLETTLKLYRETCQECIKYKTGQFEAILQVRATNREPTDDELQSVEDIIAKTLEEYGSPRSAYVFEYKRDHEGITTKVSTKLLAETLAKKIKAIMAGKYTVAYKLVTKTRDDQDVYQNTYLVRLPEYVAKDIVEFEDKIWQIKAVRHDHVSVRSLENQEQRDIERKKFEKTAKKRNDEIMNREFIYLSDGQDMVMLMAMDNYENFEDRKEKLPKNIEVGETITGFIFDDKNYYLRRKE